MKTMMENKLEEIKIPEGLHERCAAGVRKAKQEQRMEQKQTEKKKQITEEKKMKRTGLRKGVAAAAVMAVCVFAVGNTAVADTIKGYFKDVTRFDGAIIGQEYVQATNEIAMKVEKAVTEGEELYLSVELTFLEKEKLEFRSLEMVTVKDFSILDENGTTIVNAEDMNIAGLISDGTAKLEFEVENNVFEEGKTYILVIKEFEGLKKADAPLLIKGDWECKWGI